MPKNDEKQCLECGWAGDIAECRKDKQWSDHAGGGYIAVPLCPKCGNDHVVDYNSREAKDARLQFEGGKTMSNSHQRLCSCCGQVYTDIEGHDSDKCVQTCRERLSRLCRAVDDALTDLHKAEERRNQRRTSETKGK